MTKSLTCTALILGASWLATSAEATQVLYSQGRLVEGIPAGGPYSPAGTLYDNEQSDGSTSLASQNSSGTMTARTADDFVIPGSGCTSGLFYVTRVRAQTVQSDSAPQPFAIEIYSDNGTGNAPVAPNVIFATTVETSQTNLGPFGAGTSIFEASFDFNVLELQADTKYWISAFGTDATANASFFNNFFAASAGAAATTDNGVLIAPQAGITDWTPVEQVIGGAPLAFSFAIDGSCSAPQVNVVEVPTLGVAGLTALAALLLTTAFVLLRRRARG